MGRPHRLWALLPVCGLGGLAGPGGWDRGRGVSGCTVGDRPLLAPPYSSPTHLRTSCETCEWQAAALCAQRPRGCRQHNRRTSQPWGNMGNSHSCPASAAQTCLEMAQGWVTWSHTGTDDREWALGSPRSITPYTTPHPHWSPVQGARSGARFVEGILEVPNTDQGLAGGWRGERGCQLEPGRLCCPLKPAHGGAGAREALT